MWTAFAVSAALLVLGLLVHKAKMYFLISGYNTMPKHKRANVDIVSIARLMGLWAYANAAVVALVGVLVGLGVGVPLGLPMAFFAITTVSFLVRAQRFDGNLFDDDGQLRRGAWKQLAIVGVVLVALVLGVVVLVVFAV